MVGYGAAAAWVTGGEAATRPSAEASAVTAAAAVVGGPKRWYCRGNTKYEVSQPSSVSCRRLHLAHSPSLAAAGSHSLCVSAPASSRPAARPSIRFHRWKLDQDYRGRWRHQRRPTFYTPASVVVDVCVCVGVFVFMWQFSWPAGHRSLAGGWY